MLECGYCGHQVIPYRDFSWPWFLGLFLLTGIGGVLYLVYYATKKPVLCPNCDHNVYERRPYNPDATDSVMAAGIVLEEHLPEMPVGSSSPQR